MAARVFASCHVVEIVTGVVVLEDRDGRAGLRELSQMSQEFGGYDSELK
jgi:hypothetical protein